MIKYEKEEDFAIETGIMRLFEKMSLKWTYNMLDVELERDFYEKQSDFARAADAHIKRELRESVFAKIRRVYTSVK